MASKWTPENIAKAVELANKGYSGTQIAKELCVTRSAVIGKLWRVGVPLRGQSYNFTHMPDDQKKRFMDARRKVDAKRRAEAEIRRQQEKEAKEAARKLRILYSQQEWKEEPMPERVECSPRPWTERRFGECAYPVEGIGADTLSCCNPVLGEKNYCTGHARLMFTTPPKKPLPAKNFIIPPRKAVGPGRDAELFFAA